MAAYVIALINVTNPEKYQEYAKRAGPAGAKYGGKFVVRGGAKTTLEGDIPFQRIIVNEFPTVEAAKKFYNSSEYQEARKHRLGAAEFNMVIVEGAS
jgi:uncharacterized protein (DUF1330 family)